MEDKQENPFKILAGEPVTFTPEQLTVIKKYEQTNKRRFIFKRRNRKIIR